MLTVAIFLDRKKRHRSLWKTYVAETPGDFSDNWL